MGMPRNPDNAQVATTLRLPPDLLDRYVAEAERRIIGRGLLMRRVLEAAIDSLEAQDLDSGPSPLHRP